MSLYLWWNITIPDTLIYLFPMCYALAAADHLKHYILFWTLLHFALFGDVIQLSSNLFLLLLGASWQQVMGETPMRIFFTVSANLGCLIETIARRKWPG